MEWSRRLRASALNGVQCFNASELPDVRRRVVVSMLRGVRCAALLRSTHFQHSPRNGNVRRLNETFYGESLGFRSVSLI